MKWKNLESIGKLTKKKNKLMKEEIKKNIAKIFIVIGFFLTIISFIFASNYRPSANWKYNIDHMSVVVSSGKPLETFISLYEKYQKTGTITDEIKYEGRIEIPFKYILTISIILIFAGIILLIF